MTATIMKSTERRKIGFYVICSRLVENVFFNTYSKAKDFCEARGWDVVRI